jgi:hypothetical protein
MRDAPPRRDGARNRREPLPPPPSRVSLPLRLTSCFGGPAKIAQDLRAVLGFGERRGDARRVQRLDGVGGVAKSRLLDNIARRQRGTSQRPFEQLNGSNVFRCPLCDHDSEFFPSDVGKSPLPVQPTAPNAQPNTSNISNKAMHDTDQRRANASTRSNSRPAAIPPSSSSGIIATPTSPDCTCGNRARIPFNVIASPTPE